MKLSSRRLVTVVFLLIIGFSFLSFAGGPLAPNGQGSFFHWNPANPVPIIFDQGLLKSGGIPIQGEDGIELVRGLLATWEDVPTATISFDDKGLLTEDVDETNFFPYLFDPTPAGNPIIFDADGEIVTALFGEGSNNTVLGFATADWLDRSDDSYDYGFAVLNGKRAAIGDSPNAKMFEQVILHELGHLLGLDHTQAGAHLFSCCPADVPLMYPFVSTGGVAELRPDDTAWISTLYPTPDFSQTTGAISGQIFYKGRAPLAGVNVVVVSAESANGSILESESVFYSVVSDYLLTGDARYQVSGLPPGDYVVYMEPLRSGFTEGSGVGPCEVRYTNFPKDYYNGEDEAGDDSDETAKAVLVHVEAGKVTDRINLISNRQTANQLATLGDDDAEPYFFPDGFHFPFFGTAYSGVNVNSDGNLTFICGDNASFPRSEARFLTGLPRIAPLFTDLDPSASGSISDTFDGDKLTFRWQDVPEFGRTDGVTNDFSVSLFRNGDVLFRYDKVAVLPDDPLENLQAVIGVTPGSVEFGFVVDLSSQGGSVDLDSTAIFEAFRGNSFDLTGSEILFDASTSQFHLLFPHFEGNAREFTGFAVSNDELSPAVLEIENRDTDGELSNYPTNPESTSLEGTEQLARVGYEIFDAGLNTERDGWVRIGTNTPELASFFQLGNGLDTGQVTKLDGSVALMEQAKTLYFTRILDGRQFIFTPSGNILLDATTTISIANPNSEAIQVELDLFGSNGAPLASRQIRDLPALGYMRESVKEIFGSVGNVLNAFVRVEVTEGPGAVGFELVSFDDTLLGFNASYGNDQNIMFSAQAAQGGSGAGAIFTSLKVVNVSDQMRNVTVKAFKDDGSALGTGIFRITLGPNQGFQRSIGEILGLGPPTGQAVSGSLVVEADGSGVIGDVLFGHPETLRYGAALPLQTMPFSRAVFSQVANLDDPNPAKRMFTGLAFYNPGDESAQITVRVFSRTGEETGSVKVGLEPGERMSEVLAVLIPSTAGQVQGVIEVESTEPIVAQQLFGNPTLDFMSAVPPTLAK